MDNSEINFDIMWENFSDEDFDLPISHNDTMNEVSIQPETPEKTESDPHIAENCIPDASRFAAVDIDKFLLECTNKNTQKKTECDMKLFTNFLSCKGELRFPEFIPPFELNMLLAEFLLSARKKDGSEYEPTSIRSLFSSVDRYLRSKNTSFSIMTDKGFERARSVLHAKQKQLKSLRLGNKPRTAEPLKDNHLDAMYKAKTLGDSNPRALIHSLWLICTTHF